jgi:hypothetical protein
MKAKGIKHNDTIPGLHEKKIERYIQTIQNKNRAVLCSLTFEIPEFLHGELWAYSIWCSNRSVSKGTYPRTPIEIIDGKKPYMTEVTFGDVGIFYKSIHSIHDDNNTRAEYGVIIGLSDDMRAKYRVYVPARHNIFIRGQFAPLPTVPDSWRWSPRRGLQALGPRMQPNSTINSDIQLRSTQNESKNDNNNDSTSYEHDHNINVNAKTNERDGQYEDYAQPHNLGAPTLPNGQVANSQNANVPSYFEKNENNAIDNADYNVTYESTSNNNETNELLQNTDEAISRISTIYHPKYWGENTSPVGLVSERPRRENKQVKLFINEYDKIYSKLTLLGNPFIPPCDIIEVNYANIGDPRYDESIQKELNKIFVKYKALEVIKESSITFEDRQKATRTHMVTSEKLNADGSLKEYKSRLVYGKVKQEFLKQEDNTSPTINLPTFYLVLQIICSRGWSAAGLDVEAAFLNTPVPENIFIYTYIGGSLINKIINLYPNMISYLDSKQRLWFKLNKYLYGHANT